MIQSDACVYCQRSLRRQIEVLKQGKDIKPPEKAQHQSPKFRDLPPPSSTTNNIISNAPEEVQEITPSEIAFSHMNVEELLECSATEVKVVIVNPNGMSNAACAEK